MNKIWVEWVTGHFIGQKKKFKFEGAILFVVAGVLLLFLPPVMIRKELTE